MNDLPLGIYERLLDEELKEVLDDRPELRPILRGIDDESSPHVYAQFVGRLINQALHTPARVTLPTSFRAIQNPFFLERTTFLTPRASAPGQLLSTPCDRIVANEETRQRHPLFSLGFDYLSGITFCLVDGPLVSGGTSCRYPG